MTPVTCFAQKSVALFGLGGSGRATARALKAGGASVTCFDDSPKALETARADGHTVEDLRQADWSAFSALILSPGVPLTHPAPHWSAALAHAAGVEVIGDIELFCRERAKIAPRAPFIAITGTNGKSTTTALTAHLLKTFGMQVEMGGNIGTPILDLAPPSPERTHVIEVSSYQIDLSAGLRPSVGVLLNLTPDHIDRHGTMETYAAVKERLVARADAAVIAVDDDHCLAIAERLRRARKPGTTVSVTRPDLTAGIVLDGTRLVRHVEGRALPIADLAGIASLRGRHNAQNAAAAVAALGAHAYAADIVQRGLRSFAGLPHRMEQVGTRGNVLFVNDSKATNADAAEKALLSFEHIFWIVGGQAKEGGIAPLAPLFPHIAKAFLIGEASEAFARTLEGVCPFERCGTLDAAVARAADCAAAADVSEPVVLLSPACASFDQFPNFGARGDAFRSLVQALPGILTQ